MFKALYKSYPYFFNLLMVLVFLTSFRILDWIVWTPQTSDKVENILLTHLFEFISCLPILILLIYSYLWAIKRNYRIILFLLAIQFTIFAPSLQLLIERLLVFIFWKKDLLPLTFNALEKSTVGGILYFLSLSAAFYITRIRIQFIRQREATHKAETLAKDIQLKMLRYQINPHFLFNVLNSLHALIDENTGKAKKLVVEMSDYYRYTLNKQEQTSSIEKEVEAIRKYLEIQQTRFEEKFGYEISVEETTKEILIPSFIIHLLVENAVKYGIKSNDHKLVIHLEAKKCDKSLFICVSNTGNLLSSNQNGDKNNGGTGTGIENIKNRLGLFYNQNYSFSLTEDRGWVIASIEIKDIR
jgi:sensor histidine kinase YesM